MNLDLARWQFAITTVYHFLFVPLTIGLSLLVAGMQTAWVRTGDERYLRMTKFWGKLFLINFAMGVVTGIVQEFQFGMNWSDYSPVRRRHLRRAAGHGGAAGVLPRVDVPRPVDLRLGPAAQDGCTWRASGWPRSAPTLSAYFILAANSWMQHPVGLRRQRRTRPGRADRLRRGAHQLHRRSARSRTPSPRAFVTGGHVRARPSARGTWRAAGDTEVVPPVAAARRWSPC